MLEKWFFGLPGLFFIFLMISIAAFLFFSLQKDTADKARLLELKIVQIEKRITALEQEKGK